MLWRALKLMPRLRVTLPMWPAFHPFHGGGPAEVGAALHAVLDDQALLGGDGGGFDELAAFPDVVGDGLLDVHVLAVGDAGQGDERCGCGSGWRW
jgi:hypothetical protein